MNIVISINKPKDITSQDAVTSAKRIMKVKKAGHTGTLDPIATGLLIICTNRATRLASYFTDLDKEYTAVMKLGESTDTQDAYGNVIDRSEVVTIEKSSVEDILKSFKGKILQEPPMFSALKHKGKSLYTYARKGIEIDRKPREITIHSMELISFHLPFVTFRTVCSKGTYIRTLCHDIGNKIGIGAHLYELERTAIGQFNIKNSLTYEELRSFSEGDQITKGIYTMNEALSWLPEYTVKESLLRPVIHGNPIKLNTLNLSDDIKLAAGIRIKSPDGTLLAIGSYSDMKNSIKMDVVFA
jgi:tRNA pseudouridine55 synthase